MDPLGYVGVYVVPAMLFLLRVILFLLSILVDVQVLQETVRSLEWSTPLAYSKHGDPVHEETPSTLKFHADPDSLDHIASALRIPTPSPKTPRVPNLTRIGPRPKICLLRT